MSFFSINARAPVFQQAENSYHERLQVVGEQYTISLEWGFDTAVLTLLGSEDYLNAWYRNGLVRDLTWRGPDGFLCWGGYVSRLALTKGGFTRTRAIEGVNNQIYYVYDEINTATNPPKSLGQQTLIKNDTISQGIFGIKTGVYSGGEASGTEADVEAENILADTAYPLIGEVQSVSRGDAPSLQVELQGYGHMLDWFIYSQTASSGTQNASTVVESIVAADPNGIISSSTNLIDTNTTATQRYWDKVVAYKAIETITRRGRVVAGKGEAWVSGIYAGRKLVFKAAEGLDANGNPKSSNKYQRLYRQVNDIGDVYVNEAGGEVAYWHLRPDRLVYVAGLPGKTPLYVTKVTFTPPASPQLSGLDLQNPQKGIVRL